VGTGVSGVSLLRFGAFELDLKTGELRKGGAVLSLPPQPFKILVLLAANTGQLVTREVIRQQIWGTETFVDFEQGLNFAINKIRTTLGDDAETPRYIETLPRRGYRFIAAVEAPPDRITAPAGVSSAPSAMPIKDPLVETLEGVVYQKDRHVWKTVGVGVTLVLVLGGVALWWVRARPGGNPSVAPQVRSLVVLPLENLSGDPSQDYFASGVTEELTTRLAQIPSLRVVSRTSSERYSGVKKTASEIAKELGVDAIVEGAVIRSGQRIRITAQLIYAPGDRHLWAQSYDRDLRDVLELQQDISVAIAQQIQRNLQDSAGPAAHSHIVNPEAFDLYLRASFHSNRITRNDTEKAIALLEKATALDPSFAQAFSGLARAYRQEAAYFSGEPEQLRERAFVSLEKALLIDPNLADAHLTRGFLLWMPDRHFAHEAAMKECRRALELDPSLDEAHHLLGNVLMHIGLLDKALAELREAVALNPDNVPAQFHLAGAEAYVGNYDEALKGFERTKGFANLSLWTFQKASTLYAMGHRAEAASTLSEYFTMHPGEDDGGLVASMNAVLLAANDQPQEALRFITMARAARPNALVHFHHTAYNIGAAYALLGRQSEAMPWLQKAANEGFPCYPVYASDRSLDGLRSYPDFQQFMSKLRSQWEVYKVM
jgi:TolB-like protein/DNA-binding winged helix-turn-helix (wHTH) protein/Tfp pilus assembly protein PilF